MSHASKKTPWYLRFAPGIILALAGILLALPSGKVQSQSNSPTNSAGRPIYNNPEFGDAASREDCDRILKEVLADIENQWTQIKNDATAAYDCNRTYRDELKTNDLQLRLNMARAANTAQEIFWECMGIAGVAGGGARGAARWSIARISTATVTVVRVG